MPSPSNKELSRRLAEGELVTEAAALYAETISIVRSLTQADLDKIVIAGKRRWSGMDFLWGIHAHRAFHLGHLDQYLRLNDQGTPELFRYHPDLAG